MKIATITFGYSQNLGALLQAYALREYLVSLGHECDIIQFKDFDNRPFETVKGILDGFSDIILLGDCKKKIEKINIFRKKYLGFSEKKYQSAIEMDELNDIYEVFVAGSDQIWNVHKGIVEEFFLNFVNETRRKIAYSASFGLSKLPEKYVAGVKEGLERFDAISIRESSGVRIAEELTGEKYPQTLDPVFLKQRIEWEHLCPVPKIEGKYIFVYPTQITKELTDIVRKAKAELHCKVYSLFYFWGVDKVVKDADPLDFINYIRYANLVIGSSFHATAFAVIFERNLRVVPHSTTGSRVVDLLTDLQLKEKCVVMNENKLSFETIDYSTANKVLEEKIRFSKQYLTNNLLN